LHKDGLDRPGGDTGISLGAEPLKTKHDNPLPLLDFTLGGVLSYLSNVNVNQTRIPRRWKGPRRVCQ
jgi:hypothetical protein